MREGFLLMNVITMLMEHFSIPSFYNVAAPLRSQGCVFYAALARNSNRLRQLCGFPPKSWSMRDTGSFTSSDYFLQLYEKTRPDMHHNSKLL